MKSVLISIQPKWCEKIASGEKTVEVRKTRPKLNPPFKVYIYCTQNTKKNALHTYIRSGYGRKEFGIIEQWRSGKEVVDVNAHLPAYRYNAYLAEGKVIGEFVCDKIDYWNHHIHDDDTITLERASELSCVSEDELLKYADLGHFYAWHISDLVIYDQPKELSEFYKKCKSYPKDEWEYDDCLFCENPCGNGGKLHLTRPPQSWCYVEGGE